MADFLLRTAKPEDAVAFAAIYEPYVLETAYSFEYTPPTAEEMARRMKELAGDFPWLACEQGGEIIGYAYAHRLAARAGYNWSAEASVYIDRRCRGGGAGKALYTALEGLLRLQGYRNLYALIAVPNPASDAFHKKMGFAREGLLKNAGYKFGKPVGVSYWAKALQPAPTKTPPVPRPFSSLTHTEITQVLSGR